MGVEGGYWAAAKDICATYQSPFVPGTTENIPAVTTEVEPFTVKPPCPPFFTRIFINNDSFVVRLIPTEKLPVHSIEGSTSNPISQPKPLICHTYAGADV